MSFGGDRTTRRTLHAVFALAAACQGFAQEGDSPQLLDKLAEIRHLAESGDWKSADEAATSLVTQHSTAYEAYEMLGRVKDAQHKYDEAEAAYRRAFQLAPHAATPHVSLGVSYVRRGRTAAALEQFQQALAIDPKNLAALSNAGSIELSSSHFSEAEKYYQVARQVAKDDPSILLGLTAAAFGAGHSSLAQETASLLARSESPQVHLSLGLLFAKNSLFADAAHEFEIVAQHGGGTSELFVNLGIAYSEQRKYDAAKANYFKAIDLNPSHALPYFRVASDYFAQKKGNLAIVWLFRAIQLEPEQPDVLFLLGRVLLAEEYFQTAQTYLAQYTRLRADDPKGWLLLGDAFINDEQAEKAMQSYRKALQLLPRVASAHYLVGNAAYLSKHIPEAKLELLAALGLDPSHPEAQLRLGEIAYQENDSAAAAERFRSVLTAHPNDAEAAYDLAKVDVRLDRYDEARSLLEKCVAEHPDDIRFHYLLSRVYKRLDNTEKSEREWTSYRTIKAEQEFQHRFIRHSHLYVE